MKRRIIAAFAAFCIITNPAFAAWDASKPGNSEKLKDAPAQIRANWDAIATGTDSALQITNAKVSASAAIVDTKLAQITTASKVSGAAITSLGSVPSGGGQLPLANGGSNANLTAAAGKIVYTSASAMALTAAGTSGQLFQSAGTSAPGWTTATYPTTAGTSGNVLTSDGTNIVSSTPPAGTPTGGIIMWGGAIASPPSGYLVCDGSAVSRTTYSALFAVVSTTYGTGDGSTTFNLPNLSNKFPYGANEGSSAGNASIGASGNGSITLSGNDNSVIAKSSDIIDRGDSGGATPRVLYQDTNLMPPYLAVAFIIKT